MQRKASNKTWSSLRKAVSIDERYDLAEDITSVILVRLPNLGGLTASVIQNAVQDALISTVWLTVPEKENTNA